MPPGVDRLNVASLAEHNDVPTSEHARLSQTSNTAQDSDKPGWCNVQAAGTELRQ